MVAVVIYGVKVEKDSRGVHIIFELDNSEKSPDVYEMAAAWAEQAQRFRAGEIDKEDYDQWRHNFPEYDSSQNWVKTPSKEFSDAMVEAFKDRLEKI